VRRVVDNAVALYYLRAIDNAVALCYHLIKEVVMDFSYLLKNHTVDNCALEKFGFTSEQDGRVYKEKICDGDFTAVAKITKDEFIVRLFDDGFSDEYTMINIDEASGGYVSYVRTEVQNLVDKIVKGCFVSASLREYVLDYIKTKYGVCPEYPWEDMPLCCIFRNEQNQKWFGIIMDVAQEKLTGKGKNVIDVMNLKNDPKRILDLIDGKNIFKAYHMNKTHWFSVNLDKNINLDKLKQLIDESFDLVNKKRK